MSDQRDFVVETLTELARMLAVKDQKPNHDAASILYMVAECFNHRAEDHLIGCMMAFMIRERVLDGTVAPQPRDIQ